MPPADDKPLRVRFLIRLAQALHRYGTPSHRLEEALARVAEALGVEAGFLVTPTSIIASVGPEERQQLYLRRLDAGQTHLEKLGRLHRVIGRVTCRELDAASGLERIEEIVSAPDRYPPAVSAAAYAVASATAAALLGGGGPEMWVALAIGTAIGLLSIVAARLPRVGAVYPALAAVVAGAGGELAGHLVQPLFPFLSTLAGLIVLVPGLTLTIAVNELAHGHLVSGTARLSGALATFLQIGLGVAVGWRVAAWLAPSVSPVAAEPLGLALLAPALVVTALCFVILFQARPADAVSILPAAVIAYASARLGTHYFGPEIGAALGAFLVGGFANAMARLRNQPAAISLLPGLILLVPGSVGFRSLGALLHDEVVAGIDAAFSVGLIAVSLVTGLLLANLVLPSRRSL